MELRLSAHRSADEKRAGDARDLDGERRRHRRRGDRAQSRAGCLERKLTRDAPGDEEREPLEHVPVEERRPDHFVDGVVPTNVFGMVQKALTIGEGRGVNPTSVLVALAPGEQLLEERAGSREIEIGGRRGPARKRAEGAEDGRDSAAPRGEDASAIGRLDIVVSLSALRPESSSFAHGRRHEIRVFR